MTIRYAILGLLDQQPQTGYDLKKTFADSAILHWSGNNNQVYTTLLQLNAEGLVEACLAESSTYPARKTYRITPAGQAELQHWLTSPPTLPEMKNHFLVQFLFADRLLPEQSIQILGRYEDELRQALILQQEQNRRNSASATTPSRQALFQQLAAQNLVDHFTCELSWIDRARQVLTEK